MNSMEQIFKIRDSRGLDAWDKSFLFTIASRGAEGMFATWDRNKDDMGMGKDRYYKSRDSLIAKGLIKVIRRMNESTIYKIDDDGLTAWLSATQNAHSVTQNDFSATQNGRSVRPETKKNTKKNKKKNLEEEQDSVADAPSLTIDKNIKNREEGDNSGAARPPVNPIGQEEPVGPMVEDNPRHSATQNRLVDASQPWWADPYYSAEAIAARKAAAPVKEELVW